MTRIIFIDKYLRFFGTFRNPREIHRTEETARLKKKKKKKKKMFTPHRDVDYINICLKKNSRVAKKSW
jgi:hypothetical protein